MRKPAITVISLMLLCSLAMPVGAWNRSVSEPDAHLSSRSNVDPHQNIETRLPAEWHAATFLKVLEAKAEDLHRDGKLLEVQDLIKDASSVMRDGSAVEVIPFRDHSFGKEVNHIVFILKDGSLFWAHDGEAGDVLPLMRSMGEQVVISTDVSFHEKLHWGVYRMPEQRADEIRLRTMLAYMKEGKSPVLVVAKESRPRSVDNLGVVGEDQVVVPVSLDEGKRSRLVGSRASVDEGVSNVANASPSNISPALADQTVRNVTPTAVTTTTNPISTGLADLQPATKSAVDMMGRPASPSLVPGANPSNIMNTPYRPGTNAGLPAPSATNISGFSKPVGGGINGNGTQPIIFGPTAPGAGMPRTVGTELPRLNSALRDLVRQLDYLKALREKLLRDAEPPSKVASKTAVEKSSVEDLKVHVGSSLQFLKDNSDPSLAARIEKLQSAIDAYEAAIQNFDQLESKIATYTKNPASLESQADVDRVASLMRDHNENIQRIARELGQTRLSLLEATPDFVTFSDNRFVGPTKTEIQKSLEGIVARNLTAPLSLDDKARLGKLIEQYLGAEANPSVADFVQRNFYGVDAYSAPLGTAPSLYVEQHVLGQQGVTSQILLDSQIQAIAHDGNLKSQAAAALDVSVDKLGEIAGILQAVGALDAMIAKDMSDRFSGDSTEAHYFRLLGQALFVRGLAEGDFKLLIRLSEYLDRQFAEKGSGMRLGRLLEQLKDMRELDAKAFEEVLFGTKQGTQLFQEKISPLLRNNIANAERQGESEELNLSIMAQLDAKMKIRSMGSGITMFQRLSPGALSPAPMAGQSAAGQSISADGAQKITDVQALFRTAGDLDALRKAKLLEYAWVGESNERQLMIIIDISLLDVHKRIDLTVLRDSLYRLISHDATQMGDPLGKMQIHVVTGDVSIEKAEEILDELKIADQIGFIARDVEGLMQKIMRLRALLGLSPVSRDILLKQIDSYVVLNKDKVLGKGVPMFGDLSLLPRSAKVILAEKESVIGSLLRDLDFVQHNPQVQLLQRIRPTVHGSAWQPFDAAELRAALLGHSL